MIATELAVNATPAKNIMTKSRKNKNLITRNNGKGK